MQLHAGIFIEGVVMRAQAVRALECAARLLRVALGRFSDNVPGDDDERAQPVVLELLRRAGVLPASGADPGDAALSAALRAAITDDSQPGLASNLRQLMRVASNLRERLSLDNWRTLNRATYVLTQRHARKAALSDLLGELDLVIASFTTLSGFALDGMTRDPAEIARRTAEFQKRAFYYYQNWESLYAQWKQKMLKLIVMIFLVGTRST
jgi:hypothetical protein